MAEGNWSVVRVEKISAEGAQKTERHNERKNESYANLNVDTEQIARMFTSRTRAVLPTTSISSGSLTRAKSPQEDRKPVQPFLMSWSLM